MDFKILHEDAHIIVVIKPPKIPSQKDPSGDLDMLTIIQNYLKQSLPQINNPYVGLIHRLDRPVSGIMVFSKTEWANNIMNEQLRQHKIEKEYEVVVCGTPKLKEGYLEHYLKKCHNNKSCVVNKEGEGSKLAKLKFKHIQSVKDDKYGDLSLLKVELLTGRHHQIRVQLTHVGLPIWGDTKYNALFNNSKGWFQIALCANQLSFEHPKTKKKMVFIYHSEEFPFSYFK